MPYATATELLERFDAEEIAQRADRNIPRLLTAEILTAAATGGDLSAYTADEQAAAAKALALINRALADAGSEIDSYVSTRYSVPLTPVPSFINRTACDLARYYLYDDQVTETIQKRRDGAIGVLRDISTGKSSLGDPATAPAASPQSGAVHLESDDSVWRRDRSEGFI